MPYDVLFFLNSALLGVGLAMDAFSASLANGLAEPCMKRRRMALIAGIFALFQLAMPMIGWVCVSTVAQYFTAFEALIPWIALALLGYIGGKLLYDGILHKDDVPTCTPTRLSALLVQGVATSIDALSVGFTISSYDAPHAWVACLVIAAVTFLMCLGGVVIGKTFGTRIAGKASILGGTILLLIGLEIFITGVFF